MADRVGSAGESDMDAGRAGRLVEKLGTLVTTDIDSLWD